LVLRPPEDDDTPALVTLHTDPEARQYLGGPRSAQQAAAMFAVPISQPFGGFVCQLGGNGVVVGTVEFLEERGELEVSYIFGPRHWGRGYAYEALATALPWAARERGTGTVIAVTQAANERSVRLLGRLGFAERERFMEFGAPQVLFTWSSPERRLTK
jgi:RimJ/RimL family protein N-acetyltransferase